VAALEPTLISNILRDQTLKPLVEAGIGEGDFQTLEGAEWFRYIYRYSKNRSTYNQIPSPAQFKRRFKGFDYSPAQDSLASLCQELRDNQMVHEGAELAEEIQDLLDEDDLDDVLSQLSNFLRKWTAKRADGGDLDLAHAVGTLKDQYYAVKDGDGLLGVPYPWEPVNDETLGMQAGQLIIIYGRPKAMKCVAAGQRIMQPGGQLVPIEELSEYCNVPSYNEEDGAIDWAPARRVVSGTKNCVRVTTESGFSLITSDEHYYRVPDGTFQGKYKRINELKRGDWVATARQMPGTSEPEHLSTREAWVLGALVGDGNYTRGEVQLTSENAEIVEKMDRGIRRLYGCEVRQGSRAIEYRLVCPSEAGNPLLDRLRELDMHGKKAPEKSVPDIVLSSSTESVGAFLAGLLDTDGGASGKKGDRFVRWNTSSYELAQGIKHLLTREGVFSTLSPVPTRNAWVVNVYSTTQHKKLLDWLGPHLTVPHKIRGLEEAAESRFEKRNLDGVPYSEDLMNLILSEKGDRPWPKMGSSKLDRSKLFRRSGKISRSLLTSLANAWGSNELLNIAMQDIAWDRIKSIEYVGDRPCYDICIEDPDACPNFVVEGFVVHNTWVALYIAVYAYLFCNARVLFYSREMDRVQILRRAASIVVGLDYRDVKRATLSEASESELWAAMEDLASSEDIGNGQRSRFVISNDRGANNAATVDLISQKARDYEVDLLVVDAVYKLQDSRTSKRDADWKTQMHVLQDLKDGAVDMGIPCIAVTQANRSAAKNNAKQVDTSEVAFTDAAGMECDGMFRVIKGTDPDTGTNELALVWAATRDEELDAILIHGQPGYNFRLKREGITLDELSKRKAAEDEADPPPDAKKKSPSRRRGGGRSAVSMARQGAKRKK